ncbi:ATP-binding protein [Actinomadura logoneensis]|uniref:ATP-binding protein n=2 Tax=Actinomadura logoneensis TaxID=2293572 RepID=A0A372JU40_9ACTN|nr:ATP-binding protein [Actinomadura logoneensis]
MLPPEPRLPEARELIEEGLYFVLHAPRQTGKTTTLAALARDLTAEGRYVAVHFSCENARVTGDDYAAAGGAVLDAIRRACEERDVPPDYLPPFPWPDAVPESRVQAALTAWARRSPRPLVLFIDEIDGLTGASLVSVLSQLRNGYAMNPATFPHSVALCGMRDVRDYKMASGGDPAGTRSSSPFNIKAASLRLGDFSFSEVAELYGQHSEETGQKFEDAAVQRAFEASQGQPWLVNALARHITRHMRVPVSEPITDTHMDEAVERLILERATHLDSLVERLNEPRVHRVIEPILAGTRLPLDDRYNDDLSFVRDLGLVTRGRPVQIANPIYQEVIVRVLSQAVETTIDADPRTFLLPDGRLNIPRLLTEFVAFWKTNGEILDKRETYHEFACQLVFMAFLQRVVNGGGFIDREYAVGRDRVDIAVRKPYTDQDGCRAVQFSAFELKVRTDKSGDQVAKGLVQLDGYLDSLGLDTGTLIVFDRRAGAPSIADRTTIEQASSPSGRVVTLIRA